MPTWKLEKNIPKAVLNGPIIAQSLSAISRVKETGDKACPRCGQTLQKEIPGKGRSIDDNLHLTI